MTTEKENIFLFYPNIIGFARIFLAIISFWYMPTSYIISGWCYIISVGLDAIDGHAARHFNQSTKFGAMLDQLTDRCSTMGLLVTLSYFYPKYMFLFQLSMAIDVACHWLYMQTSVFVGKSSHKSFDVNENVVMRIYYQKDVLTFMCATNEIFYCCLYLLYFTTGPTILGFSLFKIAAIFCCPFAVLKTFISCVHAYVASLDLAAVDIKEREAARLKKTDTK
ncbi:CDP-diacylglycerol--inositol 3-phosphatidyltransferase [Condylostylus longicornis]|uniref:CDP-diacylglycerol--inositol 3-phosphatidyltransferase n=1 Tax=Condylostylus longicornis TaxID=2530218 RepID=UPI00244DFBDD|nr:CDP-diacylglycerol--inositol 3-phosphatidyltransferase [Condylostylus longicornis]